MPAAPAGRYGRTVLSAVAALVAALAAAPHAARIEVAVVDTGADLSVPAIAAHAPSAYDVRTGASNVGDANGHGTFVTSVVAASSGNARILVVKAGSSSGAFTDASEAAAIRYAVDHGARIINLSIGGPSTSPTERAAVRYAVAHGALVVAAAGNDHGMGNPVEYPAALLQPVGSRGAGGAGLAVAAADGAARASFSGSGSWISLAAPGVDVAGALRSGQSGRQSGTSFAAAEVSGAAALVWAADPALTAQQVAGILKRTASGHGMWNADVGYGIVDVTAAVARARSLKLR
jgi:subtilisin family serine protease